jgi:hypothetical protein
LFNNNLDLNNNNNNNNNFDLNNNNEKSKKKKEEEVKLLSTEEIINAINNNQINKLTIPLLKKYVKNQGIKIFAKFKKEDIIQKIKEKLELNKSKNINSNNNNNNSSQEFDNYSSSIDNSNNKNEKNDQRPLCMYGEKCYRKNPQHFKQFKHPKK